MVTMDRREFLKSVGIGTLLLSTGGVSSLVSAHGMNGSLGFDQLDPRNPSNFTNPLLLPSNSGMIGIFEPSVNFTTTTKEISYELIPGKITKLWVYEVEQKGELYTNPIIKIRKGDSFNTTLKNALSEKTIIHWHGLKVDWKNDAHPFYAIDPEGTYQYDFSVINRSAAYWYHAHPHPSTGKQIYFGLSSFFIVEDEEEINLTNSLDLNFGETDIPLIIKDGQFDGDGNLVYNPSMMDLFMGFLGDMTFVNYTLNPYIDVSQRIYRFRTLNSSNARIYRLAFLKGSEQIPFHIIGNDGGLLDQPYQVTEVFLSPGERVDVVLDLRNAQEGDTIFLKSLSFDPMENEMGGMGNGMGGRSSSSLSNGEEFYILKLNVKNKTSYDRQLPKSLSEITPINMGQENTRQFTLSTSMMQWFINGWRFDMNEYPVVVDKGSIEIWEINNSFMSMPHPMHIHGFPFQVLERNGSPDQVRRLAIDSKGLLPTDKGWKDTVLIWPGEKVKLAIDFSHGFPDEQVFLFHCHNLEHADQGMMINYKVIQKF